MTTLADREIPSNTRVLSALNMKDSDEETRPISIRLPVKILDKIDALKESGEYMTRSELIREAVRFWLRQREERFLMIRRKVGDEESEQ
jgi:hypothetical protein